MPAPALYWLKRDFRLADNPALTRALAEHATVLPLFILEPSALRAPETSELHIHAQCDAFNGLHTAVAAAGGELGFAYAEVVELLGRLHTAQPFDRLYSHQETGVNRTYERDLAVAAWCEDHGVTWTEVLQTGVYRGKVDRDKRHRDWTKFYNAPPAPRVAPADVSRLRVALPYREILAEYAPPFPSNPIAPAAAPVLMYATSGPPTDIFYPHPTLLGERASGPLHPTCFGTPLNPEQERYVQPVNEGAAEVTLNSFINERGFDYSKGMSSPNQAFYRCSRLSVHLAWGTISGRQVYQSVGRRMEELKELADRLDKKSTEAKRAKTWASNLRSFRSRLHWRDHFTQRLETEVEMEHRPLNPNFWELELENSDELYTAWITGTTGYPMVDACIRCMHTTGYVNFRMRAMLTSVAAHMLHLDFRRIDKPMARIYTDYEPGIHLAQLQMQAGMVGINTLRTYSPEKQFTDHDPEAAFVHRWVPELRDYPAKEIAKRDLTQPLGTYPAAVVERTPRIRAYKKLIGDLKYREGGREINERVFQKHGSRRGPRRQKAVKT